MAKKKRTPSRTIWAYAYEIVPPQSEDRLREIKALIDSEHSDAKLDARKWEGRLIPEEQISHILVVSDSPQQDRDVNVRLEAALGKLNAGFSMTVPLAVLGKGVPSPRGEG